jgi:fatty acid desaturase
MISAADLDAGQAAYDHVAAFAALRRRRMGFIYALFPILLALAGAGAWFHAQRALGAFVMAIAVADAVFAGWNWHRLRRNDESNRALLARLEAQYGEELPWLQAERQMAEIRRIQAEESGAAPEL